MTIREEYEAWVRNHFAAEWAHRVLDGDLAAFDGAEMWHAWQAAAEKHNPLREENERLRELLSRVEHVYRTQLYAGIQFSPEVDVFLNLYQDICEALEAKPLEGGGGNNV